jgi:hypothetical protein
MLLGVQSHSLQALKKVEALGRGLTEINTCQLCRTVRHADVATKNGRLCRGCYHRRAREEKPTAPGRCPKFNSLRYLRTLRLGVEGFAASFHRRDAE